MATINRAPTPKQFANAWTRGLAKAVREAGGRDGRLSANEAAQIAGRGDSLAQYGDNAVNYLKATGQKSVSIDKLIGKAHDYAFAVTDKVAGKGNRVSLVEAQGLPDDIRGDFFALRGKADPTAAPAKLTGNALQDAFEAASTTPSGMTIDYISESDFPVLPVSADNPTGKVDGKTVMKLFEDLLTDGVFEDVDDYKAELTSETFTKKASAEFIKDQATVWDGADDYYLESIAGFAAIKDVMDDNLSDVRVVKVGPKDDDGSLAMDHGLYAYFMVGNTDDGQMAGVYFGSVET